MVKKLLVPYYCVVPEVVYNVGVPVLIVLTTASIRDKLFVYNSHFDYNVSLLLVPPEHVTNPLLLPPKPLAITNRSEIAI